MGAALQALQIGKARSKSRVLSDFVKGCGLLQDSLEAFYEMCVWVWGWGPASHSDPASVNRARVAWCKLVAPSLPCFMRRELVCDAV